jgi:RNA-directed DNA polymerase
MMDDPGKSHGSIVPEKSPNKAQAAEGMEGRGLAKGKTLEQNTLRTQGREGVSNAFERIREAAKDKKQRFTALFHHVYSPELLRKSYLDLKREAAPGIDGETWRHYGERLEEHLRDLAERLKKGAYRASPREKGVHSQVRRTHEADRAYGAGRQDRPAGRRRGAERHL